MFGNKGFLLIFLSFFISYAGDFFTLISVLSILEKFVPNSPIHICLFFICNYTVGGLFTIINGVVADSFDKRKIILFCDILRGILVLCLNFVRNVDTLFIIYIIVSIRGLLDNLAQSSRIPLISKVVKTENELQNCITILGVSGGIALGIGSGIGGLFTAYFGTEIVFIINGNNYY